jgi:hypothetical protein
MIRGTAKVQIIRVAAGPDVRLRKNDWAVTE